MSPLHYPKQIHVLTAAAIASMVVAGCSTAGTSDQANGSSSSSVAGMAASSVAAMQQDSAYQDGTYSAIGNYVSPAGAEQVGVTVTIADGVITDAQFEGKATHPVSKKRQGDFAAGFKEEVVGKPIDSIALTVVNGSSLAPKGFMDALAKIKTEASA